MRTVNARYGLQEILHRVMIRDDPDALDQDRPEVSQERLKS